MALPEPFRYETLAGYIRGGLLRTKWDHTDRVPLTVRESLGVAGMILGSVFPTVSVRCSKHEYCVENEHGWDEVQPCELLRAMWRWAEHGQPLVLPAEKLAPDTPAEIISYNGCTVEFQDRKRVSRVIFTVYMFYSKYPMGLAMDPRCWEKK